MSKATVSMVEKTTGFGDASTLGSQSLNNQSGYFNDRGSNLQQSPEKPPQAKRTKRKMTMPKFDMNLKDLFSDEEIANRPLTHQPKLHGFGGSKQADPASFNPSTLSTSHQSSNSFPSSNSDVQTSPQQSYGSPYQISSSDLSLTLSNQQPYQPFAETISQAQPDFTFDDMSFLDTFPVADPNPGTWGSWTGGMNDLDLSFGTGGTGGFDASGNWDPNSFDMLNGLFFGGDNSGNLF